MYQDNLHGKEIRAIKFIDDSLIESSRSKEDNGILVTGAEDSLLKFLKCQYIQIIIKDIKIKTNIKINNNYIIYFHI